METADEMPRELAMLTLLPKMIAGAEEVKDFRMDRRQWADLLQMISFLGDAGTFSVAQEQELLVMCSAGDSRVVRLFKVHARSNRKLFVEGCKKLICTVACTPTEWPSRISRSRSSPADTNTSSQTNHPLGKMKPGSRSVRLSSRASPTSIFSPIQSDCDTHIITSADVVYLEV